MNFKSLYHCVEVFVFSKIRSPRRKRWKICIVISFMTPWKKIDICKIRDLKYHKHEYPKVIRKNLICTYFISFHISKEKKMHSYKIFSVKCYSQKIFKSQIEYFSKFTFKRLKMCFSHIHFFLCKFLALKCHKHDYSPLSRK